MADNTDTAADVQVVTVPTLSSRHDVRAVSRHVSEVPGVVALVVDLVSKAVQVHGTASTRALVEAVEAAGHRVTAPPV